MLLLLDGQLMMMETDGRVLSPRSVAANDSGRSDQFVLGALAAKLHQKTRPQHEHLAVLGSHRFDATGIQPHFCIYNVIQQQKKKMKNRINKTRRAMFKFKIAYSYIEFVFYVYHILEWITLMRIEFIHPVFVLSMTSSK